MENFELDALDLKILRLLQEDASLSIAEISERIGLSQTPCWKRLRRLETSGILKKRVALIDPRGLGLRLTVLLTVRTIHHDAAWLSTFAEGVCRPARGGRVLAPLGRTGLSLKGACARHGRL